MSGQPLLELKGVFKRFGAVTALNGVDFHVDNGEVMALVGDNGAGKSTMIKTIAGIHPLDEGQILWDGKPVSINGPKDSARLGIEVVYQDLALCDNLDVVQNMYLGRETLSTFRRLDEAKMEQAAAGVLKDLSVTTIQSTRQVVAGLSGGQRQSVAVAKAVLWNSKLVILDEPTAALGVAQTRQVLDLVKRLGEQGLAVIIISHNMSDVFEVADSITVLRLGQNVARVQDVGDEPARGRRGDHRRRAAPRPRHARGGHHSERGCRNDAREPPRREAVGSPMPARGWWVGVRNGELGSLPIIIGIIIIAIYFQSRNSHFLTAGNFVNLIAQASPVIVIGMGIVFVLLLGEIDLSVGYVSGMGGVIAATLLVPDGNQWSTAPALIAALGAGLAIGLLQGFWFAKIGVPSFVVTLAGLLAWNGVVLQIIGNSGTIVIQDKVINGLANDYMSSTLSLAVLIVSVAGFILQQVLTVRRARQGRAAERAVALIILRIVVLAGRRPVRRPLGRHRPRPPVCDPADARRCTCSGRSS